MPDPHWMQTFSGLAVRLPLESAMLNVIDLAHSLANQGRYNGHALAFYSVAEHSVLIAQWLLAHDHGRLAALAGLLHDGEETYVTDVPRPIKHLLTEHKPLSQQVAAVIARHFDVDLDQPIVHEADHRILEDEKRALMATPPEPWFLPHKGGPLGVRIRCWAPVRAEIEFLRTFAYLADSAGALADQVAAWEAVLAHGVPPGWTPTGFWCLRRDDGVFARSVEQMAIADCFIADADDLERRGWGFCGDPDYLRIVVDTGGLP